MFLKILVIRFSAFGDVAMTLPAVYSAAKAYPNHTFYVLTSKPFKPLFVNQLPNLNVIAVDLRKYKGFLGLCRLAKFLRDEYTINAVADLHDVLRSKFLRTFFYLQGKPVKHINKDRAKKQAIVNYKAPLVQLTHSIDRYRDVFARLGLQSDISFISYFENAPREIELLSNLSFDPTKTNIGFAPFAKHAEKMYPLNKMEQVIAKVAALPNRHIYLFGGSGEKKQLQQWEDKYPNVTSVVGKLTLENELLLISYLKVLVSMDSANMHLASLVATPVVSVWGATHPYLGFYGFNQSPDNAVQIDLDCRPCSVFGNVPCWRGDHACMEWIEVGMIVEKIEKVLRCGV